MQRNVIVLSELGQTQTNIAFFCHLWILYIAHICENSIFKMKVERKLLGA